MARTKGQLHLECQKLGLSCDGSNDELMDRIRDHIVKRDNLFILPQVHPMLAQNAKDYFDYDLEKPWLSPAMMEIWNNPDWIGEIKLDGVRVKGHYHPKYEYPGLPRLDSRRRSDTNFILAEKTDNFPHLGIPRTDLPVEMHDMILDGEIMPPPGTEAIMVGDQRIDGLNISTSIWNSGPETSATYQTYATRIPSGEKTCRLHYNVFDIVRYNGEWLHEAPWERRDQIKREAMSHIETVNPYYHRVQSYHSGSPDQDIKVDELTRYFGSSYVHMMLEKYRNGLMALIFEHEVAIGGEGIMFKHRLSPYIFGPRRTRNILKLKRFITLDGFIDGFVPATPDKAWGKENLIGAFKIYCYDNEDNKVHVASVSGISMEMRRAASNPDGTLEESFYGKVVEVRMQQITTKSFRGRHAVFVRERPDKAPRDCSVDQIKEAPSETMEGLEL